MREEIKLGKILEIGEGAKDAIHIAVAPVVAGEDLEPGQHIGVDKFGFATSNAFLIGIVDPYLAEGPYKGQRFYICLYPYTITSLRHEWTHPNFPMSEKQLSEREQSERWLREYAMRMNSYDNPEIAFQRLIEGLKTKDIISHGTDLHGFYELDDPDELKEYAERYLGIKINWGEYNFSCSC